MTDKKPEGAGKFGRTNDVVSQDRNWVLRVNG